MKICVYGASGTELDSRFYEAADEAGRLIASAGHVLVFGGGRNGLMGAAAAGAVACGGEVIGVAPRFFDEPGILFPHCTRFIFTESMRERKAVMEEESDAFLALPGGIGTFEEFFETLTLKQLGRHNKPITLLNTLAYFDPLLFLLRQAAQQNFMSQNCFKLFQVCSNPQDAVAALETAESVTGSIRRLSDYNN